MPGSFLWWHLPRPSSHSFATTEPIGANLAGACRAGWFSDFGGVDPMDSGIQVPSGPHPPFMIFTKHVTATARATTAQALGCFRVTVMLVAGLWFVEILDRIWARSWPGHSLEMFGIQPRTLSGLPGIVLSPFIHGGFGHLANNSGPLILLGWLVMLGGKKLFFKVSGLILLVSGTATWLFGSAPGPHLGASGLVYGYLGFLLVRGFLEPSVRWVVVSVAVGILYTGVLGSLLPAGHVSGAGHLGGFLGGVLSGWLLFFFPKWRAGRLGGAPGPTGGNAPSP